MSVELIDKEVSTEDLDSENVEKKEVQKENSKEKEKKEGIHLEKLETVLSALIENKVMSIRNCKKKVKEKTLFDRFRTKSEEENNTDIEGKENTRVNSLSTLVSPCKCGCHHGRRSLAPSEGFSKYPQSSIHSTHHLNMLYSHQSFESCDASIFYKPSDNFCCGQKDFDQKLDKKKLSAQKCLPKRLSTEQWLNSTSRQTSTETATTSSGYISPTFDTGNKRHRSGLSEHESHHLDVTAEADKEVDSETIIEMSIIPAQKSSHKVEELEKVDEIMEPKSNGTFHTISINEIEHLKVNNLESKDFRIKCNESCHILMPQCLSTTCLPSCRYPLVKDGCYNIAPYRHLHPSGGHYVSCCNSPTHSFSRFQYDENYLALAMNLEDLEFEQEEERRKRKKRRKKRRKERQARARGLMADELKNFKKASKVLDPEDLPKRARWTIVATACLLLLMSMLLVGVTLRMAPIIDEMVRKENEEMLHSLSRQGPVKETIALNGTKTLSVGNSSSGHT